MSFRGITLQVKLQFINHLSNTITVKHEYIRVVVEVAPNKIVRLEFEEIGTAPHVKNEVNATFHKRQTCTQSQTQIQCQIPTNP